MLVHLLYSELTDIHLTWQQLGVYLAAAGWLPGSSWMFTGSSCLYIIFTRQHLGGHLAATVGLPGSSLVMYLAAAGWCTWQKLGDVLYLAAAGCSPGNIWGFTWQQLDIHLAPARWLPGSSWVINWQQLDVYRQQLGDCLAAAARWLPGSSWMFTGSSWLYIIFTWQLKAYLAAAGWCTWQQLGVHPATAGDSPGSSWVFTW